LADESGDEMSEFQIEGEIEISADALWAVIRNFGDVSWVPGDPKPEWEGEGVGMIRTVHVPPLPAAKERLDSIDEEARAVHYTVLEGNPMPVRDYHGSMRVVDLGGGRSRLVWSSTWEPDGVSEEEARKAVEQLYRGVLALGKKNLESRYR